jgi:carboxypeptidase Taq
MLDLKREVAELNRTRGGLLYDALLDDYEPGATVASIDPLLSDLRAVTVPLVKDVVASRVKVDLRPVRTRFDVAAQRDFARSVVEGMGFDLTRGRMDLSTHPFCGGIGPDDVRMTSRFDPTDLRGGLFGVIHEAGHGLYEQGLSRRRTRHPLGGAISMAIHESQSRLWENMVARSRAFWTHWLPRLKRANKQLKGVTVDSTWRAVNEMRPSCIRVEADELTYNLHIILRYEIERDLLDGDLQVRDLPERWNEGMRELLGIVPRNDSEGVLQDIHWAIGAFGYFPTYSLGNLYAAQFMEAARKQIRGLDGRIARGDLATLRNWLADQIHRHDQVYSAGQLVKRVTGHSLGVDAFARHITKKVSELYDAPGRGRSRR